MFKIDRNLSVGISIVMTAVMFVGVVILAFYAPGFIAYLLDESGAFPALSAFQRAFVYIAVYAAVALMLLGLALLFALLLLVRNKKVFTPAAVELIRYISWCLILIGVALISLTYCSVAALFIGAAVLFTGLTVRVVKNVIEAAVFLKEENDLTV